MEHPSFVCGMCGTTIFDPEQCRLHMQSHIGQKPFRSIICWPLFYDVLGNQGVQSAQSQPAASIGNTDRTSGDAAIQTAAATGNMDRTSGDATIQTAAAIGNTDRTSGDAIIQTAAAIGNTDRILGDAVIGNIKRTSGDAVTGNIKRTSGDAVIGNTNRTAGDAVIGNTNRTSGDAATHTAAFHEASSSAQTMSPPSSFTETGGLIASAPSEYSKGNTCPLSEFRRPVLGTESNETSLIRSLTASFKTLANTVINESQKDCVLPSDETDFVTVSVKQEYIPLEERETASQEDARREAVKQRSFFIKIENETLVESNQRRAANVSTPEKNGVNTIQDMACGIFSLGTVKEEAVEDMNSPDSSLTTDQQNPAPVKESLNAHHARQPSCQHLADSDTQLSNSGSRENCLNQVMFNNGIRCRTEDLSQSKVYGKADAPDCTVASSNGRRKRRRKSPARTGPVLPNNADSLSQHAALHITNNCAYSSPSCKDADEPDNSHRPFTVRCGTSSDTERQEKEPVQEAIQSNSLNNQKNIHGTQKQVCSETTPGGGDILHKVCTRAFSKAAVQEKTSQTDDNTLGIYRRKSSSQGDNILLRKAGLKKKACSKGITSKERCHHASESVIRFFGNRTTIPGSITCPVVLIERVDQINPRRKRLMSETAKKSGDTDNVNDVSDRCFATVSKKTSNLTTSMVRSSNNTANSESSDCSPSCAPSTVQRTPVASALEQNVFGSNLPKRTRSQRRRIQSDASPGSTKYCRVLSISSDSTTSETDLNLTASDVSQKGFLVSGAATISEIDNSMSELQGTEGKKLQSAERNKLQSIEGNKLQSIERNELQRNQIRQSRSVKSGSSNISNHTVEESIKQKGREKRSTFPSSTLIAITQATINQENATWNADEEAATAFLTTSNPSLDSTEINSVDENIENKKNNHKIVKGKGKTRSDPKDAASLCSRVLDRGQSRSSVCRNCGAKFNTAHYMHRKRKLCKHCKTQKEQRYYCDICNSGFATLHQKRCHVKTVHKNRYHKTAKRDLVCDICCRSFVSKESLDIHMTVHSAKTGKRIECLVCGKILHSANSLLNHFRIHSNEVPYSCPVCPKTFYTASALSAHCRTHMENEPFKCVLCGNSFPSLNYLRMHHIRHAVKGQFVCSVCNVVYSDLGVLNAHMKSHCYDRPFACSHCTLRFTSKAVLMRHVHHVHSDKICETMVKSKKVANVYKCNTCDGVFLCKFDLHYHMTHVHNYCCEAKQRCSAFEAYKCRNSIGRKETQKMPTGLEENM